MADTPLPPYDPNDPNQSPAYPPPETVWIEGDHPTANPDGVTNSNVDYWPKTQEEKAEALLVDMVEPVDIDPTAEYPTGWRPSEQDRVDFLASIHTPAELVPGPDRAAASERALKAGGAEEIDAGPA